jgi:hypothetical protein
MNDSQMLDTIRKRFVGSGEEHEVLARLVSDFQAAYERGFKARDEEIQQTHEYDNEALQFARLLVDMPWAARRFISLSQGDHDYYVSDIAAWMKATGKTPEMLRTIAAAMEEQAEVPA